MLTTIHPRRTGGETARKSTSSQTTSYDAILDICCRAWNSLTDNPWRIMSIGYRDWAHDW